LMSKAKPTKQSRGHHYHMDLPSSFLMSRVDANGGLIITLSPAHLPACFR
jgi:hypothetical protein